MAVLPGNLVDRVAESLTRYSMLEAGARIGVAVSGGADSVTLLHILHRLAPSFGVALAILHVNHQLRGDESEADEQFVRNLAAELGWQFFSIRTLPSSFGNLEAECRAARQTFFEQARSAQNLSRVALGHTRSDQAETVLFRLLRGTGTAGLASIRPCRGGLIRPLLSAGRDEVRAWAAAQGIAWREDKTNLDPQFTRNRLRLETLPELARLYNENLECILAGTASIAQAEEDFWEDLVATSFGNLRRQTRWGPSLNSKALQQLPLALRRRVIRRTLCELRGHLRGLDLQHIEAVLAVCASEHGHDRVMIPEADVLRSFDTVLFALPGRLNEERNYRVPLAVGEQCSLPHAAGVLMLEAVTNRSQICANFKNDSHFLKFNEFAAGNLAPSLAVRNWRPGDELRRPGHYKPEKLKALFQEHRIVLWERKHWPVLTTAVLGSPVLGSKEEIVWTRQFGCADGFEALPDQSGRWWRLTYREVSAT